MMSLPPLILASKSPRRKQILTDAGFSVKVMSKDTEENYPSTLHPEHIPSYLSEKKARDFVEEAEKNLVITADTIVLLNDNVLGKPKDKEDAFRMLSSLSGKKHLVITGVSLFYKNDIKTFSDITEVYFRELLEEEIEYYINKYHPLDKAGAYGIQEWIGMIGIYKIVGSYYNVMGLPAEKVYMELLNFKIK